MGNPEGITIFILLLRAVHGFHTAQFVVSVPLHLHTVSSRLSIIGFGTTLYDAHALVLLESQFHFFISAFHLSSKK